MINTKSESNNYKLVEQGDIKETVLGSSTKAAYTHTVTLSEDPSNFDYLIILVTGGNSQNKRMCFAKKHGDTWYTNASPTDYRHLGLGIDSQSGTTMTISVAEWESKSVNGNCSIDSIIGVNRGGVLTRVLNLISTFLSKIKEVL